MMPYTGKPARRGNKLAGKKLVPCRASGGNKGAKSVRKEKPWIQQKPTLYVA